MSFIENVIDAEDSFVALHECLFVLPKTTRKKGSLNGTALPLRSGALRAHLSSFDKRSSAFRTAGLTYAESGTEVRLTTHMFRYWLSTAALQGGLGPIDLARWLGKTKVSAVRPYDLRRDEEKIPTLTAEAERTMPEGHAFVAHEDDVTVFANGSTGHATALGACRGQYASRPCPNLVAAVEAGTWLVGLEALSVVAVANLSAMLKHLTVSADAAYKDGVYGASAWRDLHLRMVEDLSKAIIGVGDGRHPEIGWDHADAA